MLSRLRCFSKDRSSVAALEFALAVPLMAVLVAAPIELTNAIRIQTKLNVAAGQLVEMIAGQASVTEGAVVGPGGSLGDMCTAIANNMLPYNPASLSAWIESTTVVPGWNGLQLVQDWANDSSCPTAIRAGSFVETIALTALANAPRSLFTQDGTPYGSGGTLVAGYSAISLQLIYWYPNVLPFFLGAWLPLTANATARPRRNSTIPCTYSSSATSPPCPGVY